MVDTKNMLRKNTEGINENEVDLIPGLCGVLIKFYDDNPYRYVERTQSGLIIGIESDKKYKSNETGEMESNDEYVVCAQVLAVGEGCKAVQVGEDVYVPKHIAKPIPFRKMGYYIIDEHNIMCRIRNKE